MRGEPVKKCIIIFALALTVTFCKTDNMENEKLNPFVGTWERADRDDVRLIFSENVATLYIPLDTLNWTGTYVYNDTCITVIVDQELSIPIVTETYGDSFTLVYKFEDDSLVLGNPSTKYIKFTGNN